MMPDVITDRAKYTEGWRGGLPETPCGYGSKLSQTVTQRKVIPEWCRKHGIKTLADIGAGDLNWIRHTDLAGIDYAPFDLVPRDPSVAQFDLIRDPMPAADCFMALWVVNHLTEEQARIAMPKLQSAKWLLMTWECRMWPFTDLPAVESVVIRKRNDERGDVELRLIRC